MLGVCVFMVLAVLLAIKSMPFLAALTGALFTAIFIAGTYAGWRKT